MNHDIVRCDTLPLLASVIVQAEHASQSLVVPKTEPVFLEHALCKRRNPILPTSSQIRLRKLWDTKILQRLAYISEFQSLVLLYRELTVSSSAL